MQEITFEILIDAEEDSRVTVIPTAVFKKLSDEHISVENFIYKQTCLLYTSLQTSSRRCVS